MEEKYISYFELLVMIKSGNIPKEICVNLSSMFHPCIYKAIYDVDKFNGYIIADADNISENYKFYLSECLLESSMFDKCIEIVEDDIMKEIELKNEDIVCYYDNSIHYMNTNKKDREVYIKTLNQLIRNQNKIFQQLNK